MSLGIVKDLKVLNEQLQKMSAAELEKTKEVVKAVVPEEVRLAVSEAVRSGSSRFRYSAKAGYQLISQMREFRKESLQSKKLKAFTIGPQPYQAGPVEVINDFPAIGTQQFMLLDYYTTVPLSGTQLRVHSLLHLTPNPVQIGLNEGERKPQRLQELRNTTRSVQKAAVVSAYSYEAYTVFGQNLIDFLTLQLTINMLEAVNAICYFPLTLGETFVPPGAGTVPSPNAVDLFALMVQQERLDVLYQSARRIEDRFVISIPQTYYDRLRFIKDAQGRQIYRTWEEALPEAEVLAHNYSIIAQQAFVFRPEHFFLGVLDDIMIESLGPISAPGSAPTEIEYRNTYGIAVEMMFVPVGTPRHVGTTTYSRLASIPAALPNI